MRDKDRHIVRVYVGALSQEYEALSVEASKHTTAQEIVSCIANKLRFPNPTDYELAEVVGNAFGQECKERRLSGLECPVGLKLLWPKSSESADSLLPHPASSTPNPIPGKGKDQNELSSSFPLSSSPSSCLEHYRFCLREKLSDSLLCGTFVMDPELLRDYFYRFLYQPVDKEFPDLCQLPILSEDSLLDNLKARFESGHIYTYVGSILIAINPFKFLPIYNPKYVKLYQNRRRDELPPHIFSVADTAYHTMLKEKRNQCIVISGESGSGKTESTNFLLHHLTALSHKGTHGSGVEQTILSAGPVLEAFGNAKTAHNNNSSRFGKFIQVSYRENGMVQGAIVQKYLLEKSRICVQAKNERNYHVFYYLLAGASEVEKSTLALLPPSSYHYLNQSGCYTLDGLDESYEFSRLKQSMEMVGFGPEKQRKLFSVLSAVLLLGNVVFQPKKSSYHHDEAVLIKNPQVVRQISGLLRVTEETLTAALTSKRARVSGEMLVINYKLPEAIGARDAMAKCLYGALFDWIVLQVNHALLSKKDPSGTDGTGRSIGVLDIFGFEDFYNSNSFEQFCINYANEHLQNYFNQHVFKYEQEEYKKEGISWINIGYMDNTPCLSLVEAKPNGLICILDDQCSFPGATSETLLQKFNSVHKDHGFYEIPQRRESAFIIRHYAGHVKYQVEEFREKNMDLMRNDIVSVLKNSSLVFVRELVGIDPVAVFRWAILRAFFRACFSFNEAGARYRLAKAKCMNRAFSLSPGRRRSSNNDRLSELGSWDESEEVTDHLPHCRKENYVPNSIIKHRPSRRSYHRNTFESHKHRERPYPAINIQFNGNVLTESENLEYLDQNGHSIQGTEPNSYLEHSKVKECPCCYPAAPWALYSSYTYPKNRSFRNQAPVPRGMRNLQSVKTLANQAVAMGISNKYSSRKQPISVSQQFQHSLHSLMVTLNQANPFFIRCIKSNSEKSPNNFDNENVQRQLRYTGMLETVRIRRAGYNVRLTYEEFGNIYRILLRNGLNRKEEIGEYLESLHLNPRNYQLGETKIFLRESEKVRLDAKLHQRIMDCIVSIQRWYRGVLEERQLLFVRVAVIRIQSYIRMFLAQRYVANLRIRHLAATVIQKMWRGYSIRKWYDGLRQTCIQFQARARGLLLRQKYRALLEQKRKLSRQRDKLLPVDSVVGSKESRPEGGERDSVAPEAESGVPPLPPRVSRLSSSGSSVGSGPSVPSLSESMTALTLQLIPTPFSIPGVDNESPSQHSSTSSYTERLSSQKARSKKMPPYKLGRGLRDDEEGKSGDEVDIDQYQQIDKSDAKNPFQKAKKHIKTLISGSKTKLDKHEAVLLDSEREAEDVDRLPQNASTTSTLSRAQKESEQRFGPATGGRLSLDSNMKEGFSEGDAWSDSRHALSLQFPDQGSSSSVTEQDSSSEQRFHRRIGRGDDLGRIRRDERSRRFVGDTSKLSSASRDSFDSRRESQDSVGTNDGDAGRGSRGSNASGARSPSNSSQDSLFDLNRLNGINPSPNILTQSLSYGYSVSNQSRVAERPSTKQFQEHAEIKNPTASVSSGLGGIRDVRRSRSVSDSKHISDNKKFGRPTGDQRTDNHQRPDTNPSLLKKAKVRSQLHVPEKNTKFHRSDLCSVCNKTMHALFSPGFKCTVCQRFYHSKCYNNSSSLVDVSCPNMTTDHMSLGKLQDEMHGPGAVESYGFLDSASPINPTRRKYKKGTKSQGTLDTVPPVSEPPKEFSLNKFSEYTDRADQIISGPKELQRMQDFISKKIYQVRQKEGERISTVDRVFRQALLEFKESLVSTFSVAAKQSMPLNIRYKDLIANFTNIMETVCVHEGTGEDFPRIMLINAFRGFLDEFMSATRTEDKPKMSKGKKGRKKSKPAKRQKVEEIVKVKGHAFVSMVINIPTACEVCSSFIMWPIERGSVCQYCKLACHKRCDSNIRNECVESGERKLSAHPGENGIFGVPLESLVSEEGSIPIIVDKLVTAIELYGLRQEGLYRKSGVSSKVREVKKEIEDEKTIEWSVYPVHVLTSVLKSFLRELPEPLLTFELYEEFLRAADLSQPEDRVHTIFNLLKKLPKLNYDLMERLIFHLVRVSLYEEKNRMNANSLAIVFAPCILRTDQERQVQESLLDVSRQTTCIETIISEQLKKVRATLSNIESVDIATQSFAVRLNSIRSSKIKSPVERKEFSGTRPIGSFSDRRTDEKFGSYSSSVAQAMSADEEEEYLTRHLMQLKNEKEILTSVLPSLSRTPSDDDMLSTDPEVESPAGSVDDLNLHRGDRRSPSPRQLRAQSLQYSKSDSLAVESFSGRLSPGLQLPVNSPLLNNLVKTRGPIRKRPSRFTRNLAVVDFGEGEKEEEEGSVELEPEEEDPSVDGVPEADDRAIIV